MSANLADGLASLLVRRTDEGRSKARHDIEQWQESFEQWHESAGIVKQASNKAECQLEIPTVPAIDFPCALQEANLTNYVASLKMSEKACSERAHLEMARKALLDCAIQKLESEISTRSGLMAKTEWDLANFEQNAKSRVQAAESMAKSRVQAAESIVKFRVQAAESRVKSRVQIAKYDVGSQVVWLKDQKKDNHAAAVSSRTGFDTGLGCVTALLGLAIVAPFANSMGTGNFFGSAIFLFYCLGGWWVFGKIIHECRVSMRKAQRVSDAEHNLFEAEATYDREAEEAEAEYSQELRETEAICSRESHEAEAEYSKVKSQAEQELSERVPVLQEAIKCAEAHKQKAESALQWLKA